MDETGTVDVSKGKETLMPGERGRHPLGTVVRYASSAYRYCIVSEDVVVQLGLRGYPADRLHLTSGFNIFFQDTVGLHKEEMCPVKLRKSMGAYAHLLPEGGE